MKGDFTELSTKNTTGQLQLERVVAVAGGCFVVQCRSQGSHTFARHCEGFPNHSIFLSELRMWSHLLQPSVRREGEVDSILPRDTSGQREGQKLGEVTRDSDRSSFGEVVFYALNFFNKWHVSYRLSFSEALHVYWVIDPLTTLEQVLSFFSPRILEITEWRHREVK